jgi:putative membrane protein
MEVDDQDIELIGESFHPSWLNYVGQFFWIFIFIAVAIVMFIKDIKLWPLVAVVVGFLVFIRVAFRRLSFTYTITKDCVRFKNGLIARNENEIRIIDIREVGVKQSIWQRIFGIGSVYFASAGTAEVEVTFEGVKNPHEIRSYVNDIRKSPKAFDRKRCLQCGEFIWIDAKVCPHCNYTFDVRQDSK